MWIRHQDDASWHEPTSTRYTDEGALQELLKESPGLVPGVEGSGAVTVTEFPVGSNSIDIVVVEVDGSLTLIECKLATNREVRRQVIGQILEYASLTGRAPNG